MADRSSNGEDAESGDVRTIFHQPLHPYTVGLLQSIPHIGSAN